MSVSKMSSMEAPLSSFTTATFKPWGRTHAIIENEDCLLGVTENREILEIIKQVGSGASASAQTVDRQAIRLVVRGCRRQTDDTVGRPHAVGHPNAPRVPDVRAQTGAS